MVALNGTAAAAAMKRPRRQAGEQARQQRNKGWLHQLEKKRLQESGMGKGAKMGGTLARWRRPGMVKAVERGKATGDLERLAAAAEREERAQAEAEVRPRQTQRGRGPVDG